MKYKYPKKLRIGDTVFKIIYDHKDDSGASFAYSPERGGPKITFGMKNHDKESLRFLSYIIHELKEIIQIEQSTRYTCNGNGAMLFSYGHKEHTDMCSRLAGLLSEFIA